MRYLKVLIFIVAADVLSLFVGLTLAGSSALLIRIISAVCGAGIMICLMASLALRTASADLKSERVTGRKTSPLLPSGMAAAALLPPLASWLILRLTSGSSFDFYRWHKLINGWFIQIYNMIQPDASSAALTSGQILTMLPLAIVPAAVFAIFYVLGYKGIISSDK